MFSEWWQRRKSRKDAWKCIKYVNRVMKKRNPDVYRKTGSMQEATWNTEHVRIERTRQIRGDLVEVYLRGNDVMIADWVDQSYQYGGLIGMNDITYDRKHFKSCVVIGIVTQ